MNLAIYGAQAIAIGTYEAIHNLYPIRKIVCFLVTERGQNPEYIAGIPVLELESYAETLSMDEKQNTQILIATPENVMTDIERLLDSYALCCHVRLTSVRFAQLMSFNNVSNKEFMPLSALPVGYHKANLHMFMAKFYKDKPLSEKYHMPEWITPIQVGASLCSERVANILDCDGENISHKNVNYSELTALYWMWKNRLQEDLADDSAEYYGLSHYRRILDLSEDDVLRLVDNDVDVVLPYPMPYEPNAGAHHQRYLKEMDWQVVLHVLQELQPKYFSRISKIMNQKYLFNYNIILSRKKVLADYCDWLFPILERVEELSNPMGCDRADRYIGYIAETLETIYFTYNKENLNVKYVGCKFLI